MQPIVVNAAALAIASLYYLWRSYHQTLLRRQRLSQRVAYMLWIMAQSIEQPDARFSLR